ncbi:MAG: linear amide C-N hydrolase [Lentisphaerae bacterium]|nr:linear amide C-N hydrolase [Lentisphaerota bacterium]MCP4102353.1 linear amide C-N hydrolase [Lentisphaerota bacterium]
MRFVYFFILLCLLSMSLSAGVIEKNEIILDKSKTDYLQVRHIVLRGSGYETGKALGEIARNDYDVKLGKYVKPVFGKGRKLYMQQKYPIMYERMKGIAKAFGHDINNDDFDFSSLPYDAAPFSCSAIFVPPAQSLNGNPILGRTCDFYFCSLAKLTGTKPVPRQCDLFQRSFVLEIYPDKGYASMSFGTLDLLNPIIGGINEKGLVVCSLADDSLPGEMTPLGGGRLCGLTPLQVVRYILDNCATVEEAKLAYINNVRTTIFDSTHLLVAEPSGKSSVFETADVDLLPRFTDNGGNVQLLTNFALWKYPEVKDFPEINPKEEYNPFLRYIKLFNYIREHKGKYTEEDLRNAMASVYARTIDANEGAARPLPCRTLWRVIYDMKELTAKLVFYRHDIKDADGKISLKFSKEITFKLNIKK